MRKGIRGGLTLLFCWLAQVLSQAVLAADKVPIGGIFPDFRLTNRRTGGLVSLSDHAGKVVVVECFAWWCSPACTEGTPRMHTNVTLYYKGRGGISTNGVPVQVLTVNFDLGSSQRPGDPNSQRRTDAFINGVGLEVVLEDPKHEVFDAIDYGSNARVAVINLTENSTRYAYGEVVGTAYAGDPNGIRKLVEAVKVASQPQLPQITLSVTNQVLTQGGSLMLRAVVEGYPRPQLAWTRNGATLPGATNATLLLSAITPQDSGTYQLEARNAAGLQRSLPVSVRVLAAESRPGAVDGPFLSRTRRADSDHYWVKVACIQVNDNGQLYHFGSLNATYSGISRDWGARFLADGKFDPSFAGDTSINGSVSAALPLPDGGWLVAGDLHHFEGDRFYSGPYRLRPDGTRDPSFNPQIEYGEGKYIPQVQSLHPMGDGSVIVRGYFEKAGGKAALGIALVRSDGQFDPNFPSSALPPFGKIPKIASIPGGGVIVYPNFDGTSQSQVAPFKLRSDGTLDPTFKAVHSGLLKALTVDDRGRIWMVSAGTSGWSSNSGYGPNSGLRRLLPDGRSDPEFHSVAYNRDLSSVDIIAALPGGGVVLSGSFENWEGQKCPRLVQLRDDGSTESLLGAGLEFDIRGDVHDVLGYYKPQILCFAFQSDGEILIGGRFDTVNGHVAPGAFRLHGVHAGSGRISQLHQQADGRYRLQALAASGRMHRLWSSRDLNVWSPERRFLGTDHTVVLGDLEATEAPTFFRLQVE
jgi:hypothetical protein